MSHQVERVDDLVFLQGFLDIVGVSSSIDAYYPVHGNWSGPSLGKVVNGWLLYILSESDHRLSSVKDWASHRLLSLRVLLAYPDLEASHFEDQHLELVLDYLSDVDQWNRFEAFHTNHVLRVYDLSVDVVRLDSFVANSFRKVEDLFQLGHSKHHRSDLPQLKEMVAVADPFAFPLAMEVVSGECADDPLYLPVFSKVCENLGRKDLLCVGDSKLGSQTNRGEIHASGGFYLCPLPLAQFSAEDRRLALEQAPARSEMLEVYKEKKKGEESYQILAAYGFEQSRGQRYTDATEEVHEWEEQLFFVSNPDQGQREWNALAERLQKTETALADILVKKRGRKTIRTQEELELKIDKILTKYRTNGLFHFSITQHQEQRQIKARGNKPARNETIYWVEFDFEQNQPNIQQKRTLMGWQLLATNLQKHNISFEHIVTLYRKQYQIEHRFDQLLNRTLNMLPFYLKLQHRIQGLIHLLFVALQISAIIEYQVRETLNKDPKDEPLKNLYPGKPGRKTKMPTTYLILRAFREISLIIFKLPDQTIHIEITPLNDIQKKLIALAKLDRDIYHKIPQLVRTPLNLPET